MQILLLNTPEYPHKVTTVWQGPPERSFHNLHLTLLKRGICPHSFHSTSEESKGPHTITENLKNIVLKMNL